MARSYGSYFRQRDLDKPYRGAEIVLGFLGDMMAAKNKQALGYEALAREQEKEKALKEYRTQTLASKTIKVKPGEQVLQYSPETEGYEAIEGAGGAGAATSVGKTYGDEFFNRYLKGQVAYEDADNDGVPDRTYAGPPADLWRKYQTAMNEGKEGWEFEHPDLVEDRYRNYKGDDTAKQEEILDYFNDKYEYDRKIQQWKSFEGQTDDVKASRLLATYEKGYQPKKLSVQDRTSIELQINRREDLIAMLDKRKERRTFKLPEVSYLSPAGSFGDEGLEISSRTEEIVPLTAAEIAKYDAEVDRIEKWLTDKGIEYSQFDYADPGLKAPWVK